LTVHLLFGLCLAMSRCNSTLDFDHNVYKKFRTQRTGIIRMFVLQKHPKVSTQNSKNKIFDVFGGHFKINDQIFVRVQFLRTLFSYICQLHTNKYFSY